MTIRVCLAGATGWAGSALARAIAQSDDISLVSAVSRTHAGTTLGDVSASRASGAPSMRRRKKRRLPTLAMSFFEFTKPEAAKSNVLAALKQGAHAVIGTSGLSESDYAELARPQRNTGARSWPSEISR